MKVLSTKSEREALLVKVQRAQVAFWDALRALELSYGPDAEIEDCATDDWTNGTNIDIIDQGMRDAGFHVVDVIAPGEGE